MPPFDEVTTYLQGEMRRHKTAVEQIMDNAESEGRGSPNEDEQREIETHLEAVAAAKTRIAEREDRQKIKDALQNIVDVEPEPTKGNSGPRNLGEAFVKSEAWRALKETGRVGSGKWDTGPIEFEQKLTDSGSPALTVSSTGDAGGGLPLQPQVLPFLPPVEVPLTVAALFGSGTATANTLKYLEETTTNPGALDSDYTSDHTPAISENLTTEGGLKPAASIDFTVRTVTLAKIAAVLPVSDEMMEDEPQLVSYINGRLSVFVRQAEEAHILNTLLAAGITTGVNGGGIGGTNNFDALAAAHYRVQNDSGLNPDAVVINPVDFWKMAVTKSTNGDYYGGGPNSPSNLTPWGTRAVITNAVAAGKPIVGAFRDGGTVWRKGGLSVQASNGYNDYFRRDLTLLRAVERMGLAVYRPTAFVQATLS